MTGFGAVVNTARIPVGASVVVIGCGGIGLSALNGAAIAGAGTIIAVDVSSGKLAAARTFGATHVVDASVEDPVAVVRALTNQGADFAFEAVGRKETAEQAYEMIRYGGTAVVIGMVPQGQKLEIDAEALLMEKTLTGSNMGSNRFARTCPNWWSSTSAASSISTTWSPPGSASTTSTRRSRRCQPVRLPAR